LAKTKEKPAAVEILTLEYQLAELPSSQHRAGLAGLVLIHRWLEHNSDFKKKIDDGMICKISPSSEGAKIEINQLGLEALFNEIYAATSELTTESKLRTNKKGEEIQPEEINEEDIIDKKTSQPKIDKTTGEVQKKKVYRYPVAIPKGSFLADSRYDESSDGKNGLWIKLWRDVVWSILRGVDATRKPFESRTSDDHKYAEDTVKVWNGLTKSEKVVVDLPSTYFLGAQASNAESIPFKDLARYQLLLHFWLFAAQIYIPQVIKTKKDKESKQHVEQRDFIGYAIAIPDVANLKRFCDKFLDQLKKRGVEKSGYRPRDAVVDLVAESGLDLISRLSDQLTVKTGEQSISRTLLGVDVIHAEKQGNNIRLLSLQRVDPDEPTIDRYNLIKKSYWSCIFRRQRLLNLVSNRPWYMGFDTLLCTMPYEQSIENDYFCHDVIIAFQQEDNYVSNQQIDIIETDGIDISESKTPLSINAIVFRMVKTYVIRKLNIKYELTWDKSWELPSGSSKEEREKRDKIPEYKEYNDKKFRISREAFLAVRSRTENGDFIHYFADTICSVSQWMSPDTYLKITEELYGNTDKIRTLTLLALSANS
jgi:CRISPR-associated protein Cmx8